MVHRHVISDYQLLRSLSSTDNGMTTISFYLLPSRFLVVVCVYFLIAILDLTVRLKTNAPKLTNGCSAKLTNHCTATPFVYDSSLHVFDT